MSGDYGTDMLGGSPVYNAPEKIGSKAKTNYYASDIWAFGLTVASIEAGGYDNIFPPVIKKAGESCWKSYFNDNTCGYHLRA